MPGERRGKRCGRDLRVQEDGAPPGKALPTTRQVFAAGRCLRLRDPDLFPWQTQARAAFAPPWPVVHRLGLVDRFGHGLDAPGAAIRLGPDGPGWRS